MVGESRPGARNLAVALNARGGPGIVLASVALDAGIVNQRFYTMLVLLALVTSVIAGTWLEAVLRRGRDLLGAEPADPWHRSTIGYSAGRVAAVPGSVVGVVRAPCRCLARGPGSGSVGPHASPPGTVVAVAGPALCTHQARGHRRGRAPSRYPAR